MNIFEKDSYQKLIKALLQNIEIGGIVSLRMAVAEIITAIILIIVAAFFYLDASQFPPPLNPADIGPNVFPQLSAGIIILLAGLILIAGIKRVLQKNEAKVKIKRGKNILAAIVLLVLYAMAMPYLGYYPSTGLFVILMLIFAGERNLKNIAIFLIGFIVFARVGFEMLLRVPLP